MFACVFVEEIEWPEDEWAPPEDAQDLITHLLDHNPMQRLGSVGAQQVTSTFTFSNVNVL